MPMAERVDVVIVGAGAAGLAALVQLDRAGLSVECIEARERIGGRILTVCDDFCPIPVELGAEFIHGRSPAIWDILRSRGLAAYDCCERAVHIRNGKVQKEGDAWKLIDQVMQDMQHRAKRGRDKTFAAFLQNSKHSEEAKRLATAYVEGFNAARREVVGIASLAQDARAADQIEGDKSFRNRQGYGRLLHAMLCGVDASKLKLNSIVERIEWQPKRGAAVHVKSALNGFASVIRCRFAIVTVPLGVLQSAAIQFDPEPRELLAAARKLRDGKAIRVLLRFREAFWETNDQLADAGFFLSDERLFPTWWAALPIRVPLLTGWCAGPRADSLLDQPRTFVIERAIEDLGRITGRTGDELRKLLEAAYFHDWNADPFSRGAYSYAPAGALSARTVLAKPVENTLFFAGEATEENGHSATVHGAIASGQRAAKQIQKLI